MRLRDIGELERAVDEDLVELLPDGEHLVVERDAVDCYYTTTLLHQILNEHTKQRLLYN